MSYATALSKVAELMQKVQQLERENAALRKLLREAITSLARHRAALGKEDQS